MKVSGKSTGVGAAPKVGGSAPAGPAQPVSSANAPDAADAVSVSSGAQFMASVQARLAAIPDIRTEKVEALKAKMDSDDYHPDPEAVADGLVREHMPPFRS